MVFMQQNLFPFQLTPAETSSSLLDFDTGRYLCLHQQELAMVGFGIKLNQTDKFQGVIELYIRIKSYTSHQLL